MQLLAGAVSLVHIEDVCRAHLFLAEKKTAAGRYICCSVNTSVPELAKWADKLYVFQRTPSSVDVRDNRDTDPIEWKTKIATKPGWQRERNNNFNLHVNNANPKPPVDLVDDGWTHAPTYVIRSCTGREDADSHADTVL